MSARGPKLQAIEKRLVNLLLRGRRLHYENAQVLVARTLRRRAPDQTPPVVDLVYQAVQMVFALTFIEDRRYLSEADYDPFTDSLFAKVTGKQAARVHGLVDTYAAHLADPATFSRTVAADLSAALCGKVEPALVEALAVTPRAMMRTTQLYCAMAFGDQAMVNQLQ